MYILTWFEREKLIGTAVTNASSQMYKITNLESCTEYKVTLTSEDFNEKEKSIFGNTSLTRKYELCNSYFS